MTCRKIEKYLALYISGDLPFPERERVESHLNTCDSCRAVLNTLKEQREQIQTLRNMPFQDLREAESYDIVQSAMKQIRMKQRPPYRPAHRWMGALATAVLLVLLFLGPYLQQRWKSPSQPPPDEHRSKPTLLVERPEPQVKPDEGSPLDGERNSRVMAKSEVFTGRIQDPWGKPLRHASVTILDARQKILAVVKTDAEGRFRVKLSDRDQPSLIEVRHPVYGEVIRYLQDTDKHREIFIAMNSPEQYREKAVFMARQEPFDPESRIPSAPQYYNYKIPQQLHKKMAKPEPAFEESKSADIFTGPAPAERTPQAPISPVPTQKMRVVERNLIDQSPAAPYLTRESEIVIFESRDVFQNAETARDFSLSQPPPRPDEETFGLIAEYPEGKVRFPLKKTRVHAEISGYIAQTRVEQIYQNPFKKPIEAVYIFPLPTRAAVHDFVMQIGKRTIVGLIRPREEAEQIYQEAKARGYTASLLTQERPNVFTQQVANIEPGGEVLIRITYFEQIPYEDGWFEYVFPMVVGPRYIPGTPARKTPPVLDESRSEEQESGGMTPPTDRVPDADRINPPVLLPGEDSGHRIELDVELHAGLPIREIHVPSHKVIITGISPSRQKIQLDPEDNRVDRDFILRWRVDQDRITWGVLTHRNSEDGFFTLMVVPPLKPDAVEVMPRELTFIMDVSGSMSGLPLETSRNLVREAIHHLRPTDLFNIVIFSGNSARLWDRPRPATPANLQEAESFLQRLQGGGGTEMLKGLMEALNAPHDEQYLQMYVFLTDGYIGNEYEILRTIHEHRDRARFYAFGIGTSVNRYLIEGIAEYGRGRSLVVLPRNRDEAERALNRFYRMIDAPLLVDVQFERKNLPITDVYPEVLPDLFTGQPIMIIGRYTRPAKGHVSLAGRIGRRWIRLDIPIELPERNRENPVLPTLWARHRIHHLMKAYTTAESPEEKERLKKRITDLGMKYRLVTAFTAFVAVDESRITGDGQPMRIYQPVELPEGVSYRGIFGEPPVGKPIEIIPWGGVFVMKRSGSIILVQAFPGRPLDRAGIKPGAQLVAIQRIRIHDLHHLTTLLWQLPGPSVEVTFDPGGSVTLPLVSSARSINNP